MLIYTYRLEVQYINLLGSNKKSYILGKDFGKALSSLASKIDDVKDLDKILTEKKEKLKEKGVKNVENSPSFLSLMEKCQIIRILFNRYQSLEKAKDTLVCMFAEEEQIDRSTSITLSSIHKSKGLESKRIFWLDRDTLCPSKYAESEAEKLAEKCVMYVATTRAKEELIIVRSGSIIEPDSTNEKEIISILNTIGTRK